MHASRASEGAAGSTFLPTARPRPTRLRSFGRRGAATGVGIAAIAIEGSLRGREADLVAGVGLGRRLAVLSDVVTHEVLGARVEKALASLARIDRIVLPRDPHADKPTVDTVRAR